MKRLFSRPLKTPVAKPVELPKVRCCKISCCK